MNQQLVDKFLHKAGARFGAEGTDYSSFTSSKFAELIVRECVGVADDYVKGCLCEEHKNIKRPRSTIGRKIKEHFGVEK
jgi:hypothetical protein